MALNPRTGVYDDPDIIVKPEQGGWVVVKRVWYIGKDGEKDCDTERWWFPTFKAADDKRVELRDG